MEEQDNQQLPLVSIVIPVYNQEERFLRESIESAIAQTYPYTEIIISDNHSTNGTAGIIAGYAQKDKRIRIIKPGTFLPMIENFIFAYSHVRGQYICPLSSDDILFPAMIEEHLKPFDIYRELSFSYSIPLYFVTEINTARWRPGKMTTGFCTSEQFLEIYINRRQPSWGGILFKTEYYQKSGGFSKEYSYAGDIDMIIKLILQNGGVYGINRKLSAIRQWQRADYINRIPDAISGFAKILDDLEDNALRNKISLSTRVTKRAKKAVFAMEVFPLAYFIQFKKRAPEVVEKTVAIINENYPKGLYHFITRNRKNIVGLFFSFGYLFFLKVKKIFKHG